MHLLTFGRYGRLLSKRIFSKSSITLKLTSGEGERGGVMGEGVGGRRVEEDGGASGSVMEIGKVGVGGGESGVERWRGGGMMEVEQREEVGLEGG